MAIDNLATVDFPVSLSSEPIPLAVAYKKDQGRYARMSAFWGLFLLLAYGCLGGLVVTLRSWFGGEPYMEDLPLIGRVPGVAIPRDERCPHTSARARGTRDDEVRMAIFFTLWATCSLALSLIVGLLGVFIHDHSRTLEGQTRK